MNNALFFPESTWSPLSRESSGTILVALATIAVLDLPDSPQKLLTLELFGICHHYKSAPWHASLGIKPMVPEPLHWGNKHWRDAVNEAG